MAKSVSVDVDLLKPHPLQPPGREDDLDTLLTSVEDIGLVYEPIVVPDDDGTYTVIAGWRRVVSMKRAGHKEIDVIVRGDLIDPVEQMKVFAQSNIQRPLSHCEKAEILAALEREGRPLRDGARIIGVTMTEAGLLAKLSQASPRVRNLVERADSGKEGGLSWSAFKRIANLPPDEQERRISRGTRVKDVGKASEEKPSRTLIEDTADEILALISRMKADFARVTLFLQKAEGSERGDVLLSRRPLLEKIESLEVDDD